MNTCCYGNTSIYQPQTHTPNTPQNTPPKHPKHTQLFRYPDYFINKGVNISALEHKSAPARERGHMWYKCWNKLAAWALARCGCAFCVCVLLKHPIIHPKKKPLPCQHNQSHPGSHIIPLPLNIHTPHIYTPVNHPPTTKQV